MDILVEYTHRRIVDRAIEWARAERAVDGLILVPPIQRDAQVHAPSGPVGLLVVTADADRYLYHPRRLPRFEGFLSWELETGSFGAVLYVHSSRSGGVEYTFAHPSWFERPLAEETRQVLSGGYRVLLDKQGILSGPTAWNSSV